MLWYSRSSKVRNFQTSPRSCGSPAARCSSCCVGVAGRDVDAPVGGIAGVRVVAAGAGKAVEVLGVGAGAEAHRQARVVGLQLRLAAAPGSAASTGAASMSARSWRERRVAHRRLVAELGIGEQRVHPIVEAVLLHELVVVEDRDRERRPRRHAGRVAQDRVVGGLGAERGEAVLDRRRAAAPRRLRPRRLDVAQVGDGQIQRRQLAAASACAPPTRRRPRRR